VYQGLKKIVFFFAVALDYLSAPLYFTCILILKVSDVIRMARSHLQVNFVTLQFKKDEKFMKMRIRIIILQKKHRI